MTIETQVSKVRYTGTGLVATYPYTFPILEDADLVVIEVDTDGGETTLVLDTDYTVTGAGEASGGNVVLSENLTSGHVLVIYRELDLVQETDLANQQAYFLETIEDAFDYQAMISQQLQEQIDRSLKLGVTDSRDPEDIVDDIFEARDEAQASASSAEDSAIRAEVASSTVAYYNHEGTLAEGEDTITLPWAYDTAVGVEVYLSGVKKAESALTFTDAYTVTLDEAVSADTPFEVVASAGATGDFAAVLAASGGSALVGFLQEGTGAVARTVQGKMQDVVSVFDFMTAAQIADVQAGTALVDVSAAVQAAIDEHDSIYFPSGHYLCGNPITITTNTGKTLIGAGIGATILDIRAASGAALDITNEPGVGGAKFISVSDMSIQDGSTLSSASSLISVVGGNTGANPSETAAYIDISRVFIPQYKTTTGAAIYVSNVSHINLNSVHMPYGIDCKIGVLFENTVDINTGLMSIKNCSIHGGETALVVQNSLNILDSFDISGSYFGNRGSSLNTPKEVVIFNGVLSAIDFHANHLEADGGASYPTIRVSGSLVGSSIRANHFSAKSSTGAANTYAIQFSAATVKGVKLSANEATNYPASGSGGAVYRFENDCVLSAKQSLSIGEISTISTSPALLSVESGGNEDTIWAGLELPPSIYRSFTINNAAVASFTPAFGEGIIGFVTNNFTGRSGIALYRAEAAGAEMVSVGGGANFAVTTGVLSGTTGTNGNVTVSAHTDGKIYIENRIGFTTVVYVRQIMATATGY